MRRPTLYVRGLAATVALCGAMGLVTGSASAVIVDMNPAVVGAVGSTGPVGAVTFPQDQSYYYGVAMTQFPASGATGPTGGTGNTGTTGADISTAPNLDSAGIPTVSSNVGCGDPWLSSDFVLPQNGLCWHTGGSVMHGNETFALTWDPDRRYFENTKNYVEQFLQNVANASGTLTSPYALTSQYADGTPDSKDAANTIGRAENASVYGGACVDFGNPGGYTCQFGNTSGSGIGNNYPSSGAGGCAAAISGVNSWAEGPGGVFVDTPNDVCLTDADIRAEITAVAPQIEGHVTAGYTPTVVVLTPPGVEVCLTASGALCSANGQPVVNTPTGPVVAKQPYFCSYHAEANGIPYVVVPWVASWDIQLGCDDADLTAIPQTVDLTQLANFAGERLVSPLEQSQLAAITDPALNGWFSANGYEMNDNDGCVSIGGLDQTTIDGVGYDLQRAFNNAGLIETDPNALACMDEVLFKSTFVAPSTVNIGDTVEFDGSTTPSTLLVPKANYSWSYGDGVNATGPSVSHTFTKPGTYTVTLTVVDRGGNTSTSTHQITVLSKGGTTQPPPPKPPSTGLQAHLQLVPAALASVLHHGISVLVSSNQPADGVASISISHADAHRAHIASHSRSIIVGRGTVSGLIAGTVRLQLHIDGAMARKLEHLRHVVLTVRLVLLAAGRHSVAIDAAGQY